MSLKKSHVLLKIFSNLLLNDYFSVWLNFTAFFHSVVTKRKSSFAYNCCSCNFEFFMWGHGLLSGDANPVSGPLLVLWLGALSLE
jgi:hypothetical protein